MTRPDDVPEDVWEKAFYWLDDSGLMSMLETEDEESFMRTVSRAILVARAEQREEDARIADRWSNRDTGYEIAAAIRNGGK